MKKLTDNVKNLLESQIWYLATYDKEPNSVPMAFKSITPDGKLAIASVFMKTSIENIQKNGRASISACDINTMKGYQIKGSAVYLTEGELVDNFKKIVSEKMDGKVTAQGVVVVTPETIIVTTPGSDNNKML